ncbi:MULTISPECIES: hypothetical protein [unclassified Nitrobacter]|uniref:hypothetical protein n=2 Tax=Nitrobacter TaxID=911 RepID=UPI0025FF87EE|nr:MULTISPECIES: hypothetical protein [unclassified Nitrobacter]
MSIIVAAASLAFALPALAADLSYGDEPSQLAPAAPTHMVCDDDGNCYRTRARRYVERWHDDDDGDVYERRDYRPRYVAPPPGFYRDYDDDE